MERDVSITIVQARIKDAIESIEELIELKIAPLPRSEDIKDIKQDIYSTLASCLFTLHAMDKK